MMELRKEKILQLVVDKYIESAEPVGSNFLVDECGLDVSGATVRNEMRELEEMGYLTHPHTSSGRTPTDKGYEHYIEHIMEPKDLPNKTKEEISKELSHSTEVVERMKRMGKFTAEKVHNAVIIAWGRDQIYYTGLSNLFSQHEFRDYAYTVQISTVFDQVEERIEYVFDLFTTDKPTIIIGEKNPFGAMCGLVGGRLSGGSLFTILGPLRMDYAKGFSFIKFVQHTFKA